jgi:hypothetical protein
MDKKENVERALSFLVDNMGVEAVQDMVGGKTDPHIGVFLGKLIGAYGLSQAVDQKANVLERVDGAIDFLEGGLGGVASALQAGSEIGVASKSAAALASTAGFLAMAGLTLAQFSLIGRPLHDAIQREAKSGAEQGFAIGYAAAATGASEAWVKNEILDMLTSGLPGTMVEEARNDAFLDNFWRGFNRAAGLSDRQKAAYMFALVEFAAENRVWFGPDSERSFIIGLARTAQMEGASEAIRKAEESQIAPSEESTVDTPAPSTAVEEQSPSDAPGQSSSGLEVCEEDAPESSTAVEEPPSEESAGSSASHVTDEDTPESVLASTNESTLDAPNQSSSGLEVHEEDAPESSTAVEDPPSEESAGSSASHVADEDAPESVSASSQASSDLAVCEEDAPESVLVADDAIDSSPKVCEGDAPTDLESMPQDESQESAEASQAAANRHP